MCLIPTHSGPDCECGFSPDLPCADCGVEFEAEVLADDLCPTCHAASVARDEAEGGDVGYRVAA